MDTMVIQLGQGACEALSMFGAVQGPLQRLRRHARHRLLPAWHAALSRELHHHVANPSHRADVALPRC